MAYIDNYNRHKTNFTESLVVGAGHSGQSTIVTVEKVNSGSRIHKTILTLTNCPISVVSVTTGNGVGGTKIYDMPEGLISIQEARSHLSLSIASAKQADFTDGTPQGDLGVGTVAPANADALGTDATDDNICTSGAFTMAAYAATGISLPFDGATTNDGTQTAMDIYLNCLVDAADINDDTTTEVLVSGTITLIWENLGEN